jgi:uncharacterized protein (DUF952 family)
MMETTIYHIVTAADFGKSSNDGYYQPPIFRSGIYTLYGREENYLAGTRSLFYSIGQCEEILVVEIDTNRLEAEVKFEAPAPVAGNEMQQTGNAILFPHIYGPLNLSAHRPHRCCRVHKRSFHWPESFIELF